MANVAERFGGIIAHDWRKAEGSGLARFKVNDILFGKITPCAENGKVALVKELPDEFGLGSTEFIVLSPRNENDPRYLYSLVCSGPVHRRAVSRMEGSTGRLRITEDTFSRWLHVAVPSPKEQRTIAAILDAADTAIERANEALRQVRRLRQAIVAAEIRKLGITPTKLGTFINEVSYGTSQASNDRKRGFPTLRIPNVVGDGLDLNDLTYVDAPPKQVQRYGLANGDLLLVRTNGNPNYIGRSVVFRPPTDETWFYASYLIRVRLKDSLIPEYVDEYLGTEMGRRELFRRVTTSAGNSLVSKLAGDRLGLN
jgi:type I restriction enzyme S subunit